jgi:hypothetical protein
LSHVVLKIVQRSIVYVDSVGSLGKNCLGALEQLKEFLFFLTFSTGTYGNNLRLGRRQNALVNMQQKPREVSTENC